MGGGRGYGPTHSQSLERLFFGTPSLDVVALSAFLDPGLLLKNAVASNQPCLLIENKLLYSAFLVSDEALALHGCRRLHGASSFPTVTLQPVEAADITIIAYGGMASCALEAAASLQRVEGLICEVVVIHQLSPFDAKPVLASAARTRRVVVVEEGWEHFGFGAEVSHLVSAVGLEAPVQRVGATCAPIPARRDLEARVLPGTEAIMSAAIATVDVEYLIGQGEAP
jgi:pyruvate/2-oxoglutarate/acetoin dehydrogenase E1 component